MNTLITFCIVVMIQFTSIVYSQNLFDTIETNRRDLGVIPVIVNTSQLINASYRVVFQFPDTSYNILRSQNNWVSYSTLFSNVALTDTGKLIDGLSLKVKRIRFTHNGGANYIGNVGVIKDPNGHPDSIQTNKPCWTYLGSRNLEGSHFKINGLPWQAPSIGVSYPTSTTFTGFGSLCPPTSLRKIKIVFTGYGLGQLAYRYYAATSTNFIFEDMPQVPFKIYETELTDSTSIYRQLACAFLEFPDSLGGHHDGMWNPTLDSLGGKEILYVFNSSYDPSPNPFYTAKNLFSEQSQFDILYVWGAKLINSGPIFSVNDELTIYPYTVTAPYIVPGYPLYYEFNTNLIGIKKISQIVPEGFSLSQNYPNPFNPSTSIKFDVPKTSFVQLTIYNVLGKEVAILVKSELRAGSYSVDWDGSNYPSGVYFCKLETFEFNKTKKLVLLK